jgi:hypothetical protein
MAARDRESQPSESGRPWGFAWVEDALAAWRGVAAFGGFLFVLGLLYWLGATGYTSIGANSFADGPLVALFLFCFFGAAFAAFLGYTEVALAILATALVTAIIALFDPPSLIPSAGALFSNPSASVPDRNTVVALWAVVAGLIVVGGFKAFQTFREIDNEE